MTSIRREISIECPPPQVFAVLADIERLAEGSLVSFDIEYDPPFGIVGDIADKAVFERAHEEDAEQILAGLATLCEGAPRG